MNLTLTRVQKDLDVTIGQLDINGSFECWTLEDPVRDDGIKIFGETAIPPGTYAVDITHSPRFNRELPILLNTQGFVGVRIHPGNTPADTAGCILVGQQRFQKSIGHSQLAFLVLFAKMRVAKIKKESMTLIVT